MRRIGLPALIAAALLLAPTAQGATTTYPATGAPQGTVILLHGMASNRALWETAPYAGLRDQLGWLGWNVITVDLPDSDDPATMADRLYADIRPDGGTTYRQRWDEIVHATVDQALETGPRVIVGGVSWGGLHAILAACDDPRISGWFVHAPVIRPEVLDEFRLAPAPALDGMACADRLRARPGYLSYGDQDGRVGVDLPPAFGAAAAATVRPFPGLDHTTTTEAVDYIAQWVASLSAPASGATSEPPSPQTLTPRIAVRGRFVSMETARRVMFLTARIEYRKRIVRERGQDLVFRTSGYRLGGCARRSMSYVVCQYGIRVANTIDGGHELCVYTIGVFRHRNGRLDGEELADAGCQPD